MEYKKITEKLLKAYKNYFVLGPPTIYGDWYYYCIAKGNNKKTVIWNVKTDEHETIVDTDY